MNNFDLIDHLFIFSQAISPIHVGSSGFKMANLGHIYGTAIGTKFAPTYATLVLAYLEEMLYLQTEIEFDKELAGYIKDNWKRFMDDCFILWSKGEENLIRFHSILNSLYPDLKFTIEYNVERLPYLDV